jgi:hypothetical protein
LYRIHLHPLNPIQNHHWWIHSLQNLHNNTIKRRVSIISIQQQQQEDSETLRFDNSNSTNKYEVFLFFFFFGCDQHRYECSEAWSR